MTFDRFTMPVPGLPAAVSFPPITAETLANGLEVRVVSQATVPMFTATMVVLRGSAADPPSQPGLASLTGDLLDEGAGGRDAIQLADAFAQMGAHLEIDVGPDSSVLSVTALARSLDPILGLLADVVIRPTFHDADFERVRELRVNRLRQLSRSNGAAADRVFVSAVFNGHAYGHGSFGTTAALSSMGADDSRAFWAASYRPRAATLIVSGDVSPSLVVRSARSAFAAWTDSGSMRPPTRGSEPAPDARIWLVDRPGAPQSELRIGHLGPPRSTPAYHAIVTLNGLLGGQFTSRINRRLREEKGITYGARTSFDFRRLSGSFSCDTSVQADATAVAVADVLAEFGDVSRPDGIGAGELAHAQESLTRGYVRHFETAPQLARSVAQLVTYGLADDTFDRFVPAVNGVTVEQVGRAAAQFVRPAEAAVVVVGDARVCQAPLDALGRPVVLATPEF